MDTKALREELRNVSDTDRGTALDSLGWVSEDWIAVYCGSLYGDKRLDLLFEGCEIVARNCPRFRLVIIGGGPQGRSVEDFSKSKAWCHYVGIKFGREKAILLSLAKVCLNPGLVGLGILDAFSAGLPMITTDLPIHSPEIEYLVPNKNGLITPADPASFAAGILEIVKNKDLLSSLSSCALETSTHYDIERMSENFSSGILRWMDAS
jgi:glycosyltransferase involved in cell wall biosynthesis